jgi:hypothetical protein
MNNENTNTIVKSEEENANAQDFIEQKPEMYFFVSGVYERRTKYSIDSKFKSNVFKMNDFPRKNQIISQLTGNIHYNTNCVVLSCVQWPKEQYDAYKKNLMWKLVHFRMVFFLYSV